MHRDWRFRPYAFVQYEHVHEAQFALENVRMPRKKKLIIQYRPVGLRSLSEESEWSQQK